MKHKPISGDELAVGGQAVLEGVMMRGKTQYAVSVRSPQGDIKRLIEPIPEKEGFSKVLRKTPFLRGIFSLYDSLKIGYKALDFSAEIAVDEEDEDDSSLGVYMMFGMFVLSLVIALFFFKFLPFWLSGFIISKDSSFFVWLEGLIKASIFILYLLGISISKQIRRVFAYHGAEHKVVHCYEDHGLGKKLTVENARKYSRIHKRCGTTFLFLVIFISILVYAIIPLQLGFWLSLVIRILFLPVIAGIAFEILRLVPKLSSKNPLKWLLVVVELPGLGLQYLTTREPDDAQLEVAIDALKHVID